MNEPNCSGSSAHPPVKGVLHDYLCSLSNARRSRWRPFSCTTVLARRVLVPGPGVFRRCRPRQRATEAGTIKADALKGVTLTFVSYGGIYQDGQMAAAVDPFAKESGAQILQDGPTDNAKIKAQVDSGNVTWDVIDSTNVFTAQHCGDLFMPIDTSIVDISKIPPGAKTDDCSVPAMQYGLIVVYNTEKYGANPPKTWADFFDTAKYPGKRAIQGKPGELDPGVLEGAVLADGVAPDKVYPIDVDRARCASCRVSAVTSSSGIPAPRRNSSSSPAKSTWRCCGAGALTLP